MTRHDLKEQLQHDTFTDSVANVVQYTSSHRQQVIRAAAAVAAVLVIAGLIIWYATNRRAERRADLEAAFVTLSAPVGPPNQFGKTFPTEAAKHQASLKALQDVVNKDGDSHEGMLARYYLGTLKASDDGKSAESDLRAVVDSGGDLASLAKIALSQLYAGENRMPEAKDLLNSLVNHPTSLVSKEQAQILLAELEQTTNPQDAKKILQALKKPDTDPAISRAADQLTAQLAK